MTYSVCLDIPPRKRSRRHIATLLCNYTPDRNKAPNAGDQFTAIAQAYAKIRTPEKRVKYDTDNSSSDDARTDSDEWKQESADESAIQVFLETMAEIVITFRAKGYSEEMIVGALIAYGCPESAARQLAKKLISDTSDQSEKNTADRDTPPPVVKPTNQKIGLWPIASISCNGAKHTLATTCRTQRQSIYGSCPKCRFEKI